jgi:hypothetical protein
MDLPAERLPALLRHMVIAIFAKLPGDQRKRFIGAMNIARARLVELRYLTPPSLDGPLERIQLTSAGSKKNLKHISEGRNKNNEFKKLYDKYRADLEVQKSTAQPDKNKIDPE